MLLIHRHMCTYLVAVDLRSDSYLVPLCDRQCRVPIRFIVPSVAVGGGKYVHEGLPLLGRHIWPVLELRIPCQIYNASQLTELRWN